MPTRFSRAASPRNPPKNRSAPRERRARRCAYRIGALMRNAAAPAANRTDFGTVSTRPILGPRAREPSRAGSRSSSFDDALLHQQLFPIRPRCDRGAVFTPTKSQERATASRRRCAVPQVRNVQAPVTTKTAAMIPSLVVERGLVPHHPVPFRAASLRRVLRPMRTIGRSSVHCTHESNDRSRARG